MNKLRSPFAYWVNPTSTVKIAMQPTALYVHAEQSKLGISYNFLIRQLKIIFSNKESAPPTQQPIILRLHDYRHPVSYEGEPTDRLLSCPAPTVCRGVSVCSTHLYLYTGKFIVLLGGVQAAWIARRPAVRPRGPSQRACQAVPIDKVSILVSIASLVANSTHDLSDCMCSSCLEYCTV